MSATTIALELPRTTQRTWYSTCSMLTGSVELWPWITMPRESPDEQHLDAGLVGDRRETRVVAVSITSFSPARARSWSWVRVSRI